MNWHVLLDAYRWWRSTRRDEYITMDGEWLRQLYRREANDR